MKENFFKWSLKIIALLLLFWWPLSHLLYSELYHRLLGFSQGTYQPSMVVMIGVLGFLPVMLLWLVSTNPQRYKEIIYILIILCILLMLTYMYLIAFMGFPRKEYLTVLLCLGMGLWLFVNRPKIDEIKEVI